MRPSSLFAPLLGLAAFAAAAVSDFPAPEAGTVPTRGCGTARAVQEWIDRGGPAAPAARFAASTAANPALRGRTYFTPHFALHYSVNKSVHQVTWTAGDAALRSLRDSLYAAFGSADPQLRDSLLHDRLDSLGAPHPAYVLKAAQYFERAYAYYADTLGMRMPDSNLSGEFGRPSKGRFSVDILDITAIHPAYTETYGLTTPPPSDTAYGAPILLENDFIYGGTWNGTQMVNGKPIRPVYNQETLHDYSVEWEKGLAVTIPHEYYHAIQFKYTSKLLTRGYHAWYELSATGMEERFAPDVNDYLQYLWQVIPKTGSVSLLTPPPSGENYANGIFHIYLTHVLGRDFDVALWERLRNNTNNLPNALLTAFGSEARWDSLYTGYAAALSLAGRPGAGSSPLAFSPDMGLWMKPTFDSALPQPVTQAQLAPLTFRLIRPTASGTTWATLPGMRGGWRMTESGTNYSAVFLPDSILPVSAGAFAVTVANASPLQSRLMKLTRAAAGISAYPNPARAGGGSVNFNAQVSGVGGTLTVVSESGKRVAQLSLTPSGTWTWNLRDASGRPVPPGVYYFGVPGETPRTLLLLP
jgi:hypothetical protein